MWDVVAAGHICLDVIPDLSGLKNQPLETLFVPGRLTEIGPATFATGGPVANAGLALHRLGERVQLMGKVGQDRFGRIVCDLLDAVEPGMARGMIVDAESSTSYSIVLNPPNLDRIFLHDPGANATFRADDVRYDVVAQSRIFHFGYPPLMRSIYAGNGAELVAVFRRAKETGVTTSLDMSLPDPSSDSGAADWRAILRATLPFVDIFLPSIEEICFMLRREVWEAMHRQGAAEGMAELLTPTLLTSLGQELLDYGARIVMLKLGRSGVYLCTAGQQQLDNVGHGRPADCAAWARREIWSPSFAVDVVGTTGSGDAAIAALLTALLRGLSPEQAVVMASAVGACNVEAADALGGIRTWKATRQRIADGWQRNPLTIRAPGWDFDAEQQIWLRN